MKVVSEPPIQFKCDACGAINQGLPHEFRARNTMPPTWSATCASCHLDTICSPTPLIARAVALHLGR